MSRQEDESDMRDVTSDMCEVKLRRTGADEKTVDLNETGVSGRGSTGPEYKYWNTG